MSQHTAQISSSASVAKATASSPRRGKLLELAHRLEDLGRRVEGFIDEQLEQLEQASLLVQSQPQQSGATTTEDLQQHREAWEREQRDEIRKIEEDRRALADAWVRLEAEQRQAISKRDAKRDTARRVSDVGDSEESEQEADAGLPSRATGRKKLKAADESGGNGRQAMDASTRQAMMRQFQQLRSDVRKHAQRRQQC